MGFLDSEFIRELINHNSEDGHIFRGRAALFDQRATALAKEFTLKADEVKDAYQDKQADLADLHCTMQDARTLKNFLVPFLALVGIAVAMPVAGPCMISRTDWRMSA